ncbi:MAG: hypothetical protein PVH19_07260 [Planctomycetia bacterium]|jgi:hypothetical protein
MDNTNYDSPSGNLERFARAGGFLIKEPVPGEPKPLFEYITMQELMSRDYRTVYLCNGVLAKGQPVRQFSNFCLQLSSLMI